MCVCVSVCSVSYDDGGGGGGGGVVWVSMVTLALLYSLLYIFTDNKMKIYFPLKWNCTGSFARKKKHKQFKHKNETNPKTNKIKNMFN